MAHLLPEQLEFDFFAPPAPEKLKQSENKAKSTAFKDTDILKFQLNKDGSRKLEDFGEDLNNTRKGRSRTTSDIDRFLELPESDLQKYLASEPLEKIWPKASIQALAHENPEAGACLWLVRQELGDVRPRQNSIKYRRYMATAKAAIDLHRQAAIGELAPEVQTAAFDSFYAVRDNYKYLSAIDPKYWPMLGHHYFKDVADICKYNDYRLSNGRQLNEYAYLTTLPYSRHPEIYDFYLINSSGSRVCYNLAGGKSWEEFKENINQQLEKEFQVRKKEEENPLKIAADRPEKTKPIELFGRSNRKSEYEVYGKQGSIEFQLTDKAHFDSKEDFWKFVAEHKPELESRYRELKEEFSRSEKDWRSGNPIRDRVGPDYRQGTDATPEIFQETFGFRGVEFGNWVKQGKNGRERQWMLNNAYDSLMDLSKILDIPPKAVALDGGLGLAFGSRGHGAASAHYEVANRVINLTKTKGYSSLAHEWFHALDHYLMRTNYKEIQDPERRYLSQQVDSSITVQLTEDAKREIFKRAESVYRSAKWIPAQVEYLIKNDSKNFDAAIKMRSR